jgi:integrase
MKLGDFQLSIKEHPSGRVFLTIYHKGRRHRYANARVIGEDISPNRLPIGQRFEEAEYMRSSFIQAIRGGWIPKPREKKESVEPSKLIEVIENAVTKKLSNGISHYHKRDLRLCLRNWNNFLKSEKKTSLPLHQLTIPLIQEYLQFSSTKVSMHHSLLKNTKALLRQPLRQQGIELRWEEIQLPKPVSTLHKPIKDVQALLSEVEAFNPHLHLCCLLAYGCLLRPHREIRELTWNDFADDLSFISLSGSRNKGKRNRIVPIPAFVLPYLHPSQPSHNIFTGTETAFNPDYFKTLWGKFKKKSVLLQKEQTLYSFRHTGAINVFKKTGSLQKLQSVMGHSNLQVTLTYLRGLEVPQLSVDDMPEL